MIRRAVFIIFIFAIIGFLNSARAQQEIFTSQNFSVEISPESPAPLSQVKIKITSYTFDADRAVIRWVLNGKQIAAGTGMKEINFTVGAAGSVSSLTVEVLPKEGGSLEKNIEVRPQGLDLLVESTSFIPPWYRGASAITPGGRVTVAAIPAFVFEGSWIDPKSMIYNWKIDSAVRGDLSGRGRDSISVKTPGLAGGETIVSVNVSSSQGTLQAEASTRIESRLPELLFYERRPLEGIISSRAVSWWTINSGSQIEVEAVPFFANFASFKDLEFKWNFENKPVTADPSEPNRILIKSSPGVSADSLVALTVSNLKNILEELSDSLTIYVR